MIYIDTIGFIDETNTEAVEKIKQQQYTIIDNANAYLRDSQNSPLLNPDDVSWYNSSFANDLRHNRQNYENWKHQASEILKQLKQ